MDAWHTGADARDDFVDDAVRRPRPVLRARFAPVAGAEEDGLAAGGGRVAAEVDDELVHRDAARDGVPLAVHEDGPAPRGVPGDAVAVAERDEAECRVAGGDVEVPVADAVAAGDPLDEGERGDEPHDGAEPEVGVGAHGGAGREPVHRDPGPYEVVVALGEAEGGGRVGDVPDLGADAEARGEPCHLLEEGELGGDGGVSGLVGAGEVRPQADDPDQALRLEGEGVAHECGPVGGLAAVAAEAGVRLEMDTGRGSRGAGGGGDLVERPLPAHRDVDVGLDRGAPGAAGRPQPAQHAALGTRRAQRERLGGRRDAEPARPGLPRGPRAGERTVPVGVGLDHRHERRTGRALPQQADIGPQSGKIDLGPGALCGGVHRDSVSHCGREGAAPRAAGRPRLTPPRGPGEGSAHREGAGQRVGERFGVRGHRPYGPPGRVREEVPQGALDPVEQRAHFGDGHGGRRPAGRTEPHHVAVALGPGVLAGAGRVPPPQGRTAVEHVVPLAPVLQAAAAAGREVGARAGVGDPQSSGGGGELVREQPVQERREPPGGARRQVRITVVVVALREAEDHGPGLPFAQPPAQREKAVRPQRRDGPRRPPVHGLDLDDGAHEEHAGSVAGGGRGGRGARTGWVPASVGVRRRSVRALAHLPPGRPTDERARTPQLRPAPTRAPHVGSAAASQASWWSARGVVRGRGCQWQRKRRFSTAAWCSQWSGPPRGACRRKYVVRREAPVSGWGR
ncbi:putative alanine racemase [Streptomyces sp. Tu6071]|nr:putative alanine racemase [Streptomyces sp. Tu6071]